jgi:hypothetical protein
MPNLSQGRAPLTAVILGPKNSEPGTPQERERAMMAMFQGVDRNRNMMIAAAVVVVILVIIYLYTAAHLSGII